MENFNKDLVENLKETIESTLSAEENAKRMEEFFLKTKQKEVSLNQEIKKKADSHFKVIQELHALQLKEKNYEAELNGCDATLKNLENRINKLDHESLKQAEVIYTQVNLHLIFVELKNKIFINVIRILTYKHWRGESTAYKVRRTMMNKSSWKEGLMSSKKARKKSGISLICFSFSTSGWRTRPASPNVA